MLHPPVQLAITACSWRLRVTRFRDSFFVRKASSFEACPYCGGVIWHSIPMYVLKYLCRSVLVFLLIVANSLASPHIGLIRPLPLSSSHEVASLPNTPPVKGTPSLFLSTWRSNYDLIATSSTCESWPLPGARNSATVSIPYSNDIADGMSISQYPLPPI